jgi:hypothetical protein
MATQEQLDAAPQLMLRLPALIELCEAVAKVCVELKQQWYQDNLSGAPAPVGDYALALSQVINAAEEAESQIANMRATTASPDLIRASVRLWKIRQACFDCPFTNVTRVKQGGAFSCLVKEQCDKKATRPFRFVIDEKGRVHESQ